MPMSLILELGLIWRSVVMLFFHCAYRLWFAQNAALKFKLWSVALKIVQQAQKVILI